MTTLQEAARKALFALEEATTYTSSPSWSPSMTWDCESAIKDLRTALAQQELPQKERPDFMAGYDAGMADAKRMAQQGEQRCTYCDGTGDVNGIDGEWRGTCPYAAVPAPQPAHQGERAELIRRLLAIANTEANEVADALNEAADMLQSAQPVAQYDKTEMNAFVTDLYQRKITTGQHGFYETLFHVVHKAIERAHGIREVNER